MNSQSTGKKVACDQLTVAYDRAYTQYKCYYVNEVCINIHEMGSMYSVLGTSIRDAKETDDKSSGDRRGNIPVANGNKCGNPSIVAQIYVAMHEAKFAEYLQLLILLSGRYVQTSYEGGSKGGTQSIEKINLENLLLSSRENVEQKPSYESSVGFTVSNVRDLHTIYATMENFCILLFRRGPLRSETHFVHTRDYCLSRVEKLIGEKRVATMLGKLGYKKVQRCDASNGLSTTYAAVQGARANALANAYKCYSNVFELINRDDFFTYHTFCCNVSQERAMQSDQANYGDLELVKFRQQILTITETQLESWLHSAFKYCLMKNEARRACQLARTLKEGKLRDIPRYMRSRNRDLSAQQLEAETESVCELIVALWRCLVLKLFHSSVDKSMVLDDGSSLKYLWKCIQTCGSLQATLFALERIVSTRMNKPLRSSTAKTRVANEAASDACNSAVVFGLTDTALSITEFEKELQKWSATFKEIEVSEGQSSAKENKTAVTSTLTSANAAFQVASNEDVLNAEQTTSVPSISHSVTATEGCSSGDSTSTSTLKSASTSWSANQMTSKNNAKTPPQIQQAESTYNQHNSKSDESKGKAGKQSPSWIAGVSHISGGWNAVKVVPANKIMDKSKKSTKRN